jgi:protein-tyrosine-phosphatase
MTMLHAEQTAHKNCTNAQLEAYFSREHSGKVKHSPRNQTLLPLRYVPVLCGEAHVHARLTAQDSRGYSILIVMDSGKKHNIPPIRPTSPSPLSSDIARQIVSKQQHNNYHSSSLKEMVSHSVNKTALHPGGVE